MKRYIPLLLTCALISLAQETNTPPRTNAPIQRQSRAARQQPQPLAEMTFHDGVLYGALLARRNADLDGELLIQFAVAAWRRDHPTGK